MPPLPPDFPALTSGSSSVVASVNPANDTSRNCPVRQASRKSKWVPFDIETPAYVPKTAGGGRKKTKHRNTPLTLSPGATDSAAKPPRKPEAKSEDSVKSSSDANRERRLAQRRKKKGRTGQQAQRDSTPGLPGSPRKPMSPSAVSTCSLASLLSSSSGIGSGDSSRAAIGSAADSECGIMSPKTVVSSACSTIDPVEEPKFDDDFEHFDDEENEETVIVTPIPSLLDGFAGLTMEHQQHEVTSDAEENIRSAASTTSTFDLFSANVPPPNARVNLRDPAIRRYYNQQRRFYRQIYEQQLAVYAAVAQAYSGGSENGTDCTDGAFRGRSNSTGEGPRRRGHVPHQHLGLPPLPPPTAVQPTYWPPPPLARAPPGYVFVPYSQLAAMATGEESWEEWSVCEDDGSTQPHQQQQQEQAAPSSTSITPSTPVTTTTTEAAAAVAEMPVDSHPPHQHNSSAAAAPQANDARPHRDQSNYHHHNNDGGHYRHHNGGGGQRHTQTISSRSLQHRHSQRSGSSSGSGGYIATPMPTSNGTAMPVPSRPASGEGTMCESGYQSESRGSPLTDDAEAVIVEPIPRAESKRRNYQQRAHSTSTFDDAAGQPVVQPILFDRRNHGSDPSLRRYASGLGSSRDLDENERISYSMPPAHQHPPPRVLRTLSQSYQQNNYQRPRRPSNLQNFNSPSQPFTGQRRYDNRTNSFDRNNVENIAIAVTVPTNGSGPKSAPPITAKNPRASVGSASQAPPNAFPQRAYQFTSARDHVQSAGQIMGMPQHVEVSQMDVLSERIFHFHHTVEQPQQLLNRKLQLRDMIYYTISPIFPMCGLYIVGSSLNGFGNAKSDMDLCLMITNKDLDQRTDAVVVLSSIMRALQDVKFITSMQMILAKVPILRMKFASPFDDIVVDLNANNSVAIRNTHLLCYYSSFDWRVRPLVSVVKEWAKRRGINDANRSSFTSYSLVLLVIHYLQCGASPPVLPSLQQLYQKRFSAKADVRNLNVSIPLDPPPQQHWEYRNKQSLGELLINFLEYYAKRFNFDNDAISVRMGKKTGRAFVAKNASPYNHLSQWRCICIEEPFTLTNTAHSVYDERVFQAIKQSFVEGYKVLEETRDLDAFLSAASSATAIPNIGSGHHYQQQPVNDGRPQ